MKISSWFDGSKPINRALGRTVLLLNLFATPGLGSLLARRWWSGIGQLLLAVVGFLLIMVWFVRLLINYYSLMDMSYTPPPQSYGLLIVGAVFFVGAWFWSLITSVCVLREASRLAKNSTPPPLSPG